MKALKDIDYEVRDRNIGEVLLDMEMQISEPMERTILYNGIDFYSVVKPHLSQEFFSV